MGNILQFNVYTHTCVLSNFRIRGTVGGILLERTQVGMYLLFPKQVGMHLLFPKQVGIYLL